MRLLFPLLYYILQINLQLFGSLVSFSFEVFHSQQGQSSEDRDGNEGGWPASPEGPQGGILLCLPQTKV